MESSTIAWIVNPSRRRWLVHSCLATGALVLESMRAFGLAGEEISRNEEAIHQEITFNAKPERIYDALTNPASFQKVESLSGAMRSLDIGAHPARISADPGGAFSLFGDYIVGRQIELIENKRIVQAWRASSWASGIYSIARFELVPLDSGAKLTFDHTGFPRGAAEHLAQGWHSNYWDPLRKFLG
jgi:activator of HSP90 ATPase